ncbi:MAG: NAD-dependent epimerase/dehydratase family protein [Candidatus Bipolaricaulota bacterium]|nr:NAD-dependent epimerase/dehydratase family protein [Candidatus Bipolaricaulota bacterium]MDW8030809.1 NAD-dependent epimerase/dehydratase family protein [Candidatus Bipolaricaulota bacterium]
MATIFLTGATGFVGCHLVPRLLAAGHQVRCLVRSLEKARWLQELGCEITVGELPAEGITLGKAEIVIHLAALHRGLTTLLLRTNVTGTAQLARAAHSSGVKRIIYLSTVTAAPNPAWPYAYSAWLAERALQESSVRSTILRNTVIVGPGDPFLGSIIRMVRAFPVVPLLGSGRTRFQPISVFDLVRCILHIVQDEQYPSKVVAIGGPQVLSYEQIVDMILEMLRISKRKISLPRRGTRWCVRGLERLGVHTPFVPEHFLSIDLVAASTTVIEDEFGFRPQTLREVLHTILGEGVASPA